MAGQFFGVLCILVLAGVLSTGCSSLLVRPQVSVTAVSLSSITLSNLEVEVTFSVENQNPVGITLESLSFDLYSKRNDDWFYLSHGEKTGIEIAPGHNEVTIPVVVNNYELLASLASSIARGEITLQVRGTASAGVFGLTWDIPFIHTETVPLHVPWKVGDAITTLA